MKHHLKRVIGAQKYSWRAMSALTTSIEACLNSRPLCALSDDADDFDALSPAHFLIRRAMKLPMHKRYELEDIKSLKRLYQEMKFQVQAFWKQWSAAIYKILLNFRNGERHTKI